VKSESTNKFGEIPDPPSGCILDRRRRSRRRPAANVSVVSGYRTRPASASKRHKTSCRRPGQAVTLECLSPKRWSGEGLRHIVTAATAPPGPRTYPRSEGVRSRRTTGLRGAVGRSSRGLRSIPGQPAKHRPSPASAHPTQTSSANSSALIAIERTHKTKTGCGEAEHVG